MTKATIENSKLNPNKILWEKGDFTRIAQTMRESGEDLAIKLGLVSGLRVLDLGCGDGTTAIPAARLGANVLGVDISSNLVAAGNERARQEGLTNILFQEGDAADLSHLQDRSFDRVISIFGAMFAFRPLQVAKELVRLTKPGGKIIMGNWIPGDPTLVAQILKISSSYTPPPPNGFVSPMLWGIEGHVLERFWPAGIDKKKIKFERDSYTFKFEGSPAEFVEVFKTYYGPTMNAFDAASANGHAHELQNDLEALFKAQNRSVDPARTVIPANYLRVTVSV
jgi:ubiquinone/menaquinone biosynthesis C-methylase UbiE